MLPVCFWIDKKTNCTFSINSENVAGCFYAALWIEPWHGFVHNLTCTSISLPLYVHICVLCLVLSVSLFLSLIVINLLAGARRLWMKLASKAANDLHLAMRSEGSAFRNRMHVMLEFWFTSVQNYLLRKMRMVPKN